MPNVSIWARQVFARFCQDDPRGPRAVKVVLDANAAMEVALEGKAAGTFAVLVRNPKK